MGDIGLHLLDEVGLGLLGGEAGDALQHLGLAALDEPDLLLLLVGSGVLGGQGLFLALDGLGLAVDVLFFLLQSALLLLQVGAALLDFLLVFSTRAQDLLLGFHHGFPLLALGILDGLVDDTKRFLLSVGDLSLIALRLLLIGQNTSQDAKTKRRDRYHNSDPKFNHWFPPDSLLVYQNGFPFTCRKQSNDSPETGARQQAPISIIQ